MAELASLAIEPPVSLNEEKRIEDLLSEHLDAVLKLTSVPLAFGHICRGDLSRPNGVRLTRLCTKDSSSFLREIAIRQDRTAGADRSVIESKHAEAFRRHILNFGREATLLDWLTRLVVQWERLGGKEGRYRVMRIDIRTTAKVPLASRLNAGKHTLVISVSEEWCNLLLPDDVINPYLEHIYQEQGESDDADTQDYARYLREQIIGARRCALTAIGSSKSELEELASVYPNKRAAPLKQWTLLGALQTGLMFLRASGTRQKPATSLISVGRATKDPKVSPPVCIFSTGVTQKDDSRVPKLIELMRERVGNVLDPLIAGLTESPYEDVEIHSEWDRLCRGARTAIIQEVEQAFGSTGESRWKSALLFWLGLVVDRLRHVIHEGITLPMYWVMSDLSQVRDSGHFELVRWSDGAHAANIEEFIPSKPNTYEQVLDALCRSISKRNYSWFLNGTFALVWDATFRSERPAGLLRLKNGSWEVLVSLLRAGATPPCAVTLGAIAYKQADGSGGVIMQGTGPGPTRRFKQVLSFRRNQPWQTSAGDLHGEIRDYLYTHGVDKWPDDTRRALADRMADVLAAISSDPHAGCALAILIGQDIPAYFAQMGDPWLLQGGDDPLLLRTDQLQALMAMDGATCLYCPGSRPRIAFRRLLAGGGRTGLSDSLQKAISGEGSRKWSSALAAGHDDVHCIITVSQDGPVHIYRKEEKRGSEKVEVIHSQLWPKPQKIAVSPTVAQIRR